jgi:hypothetical protein
MQTLNKKTVAATGAAGVVLALTTAPASADQGGPWTNNGCSYSGQNYSNQVTAQSVAETWGNINNCSGYAVRLYYTDVKGQNGSSTGFNFNGQAIARATGPEWSEIRYSCHQARSTSHGNWSVVRKVGSGAGSCPSSLI